MPEKHDYRIDFRAQFVLVANKEGVPLHTTMLREFWSEEIDFSSVYETAGNALHYLCQNGIDLVAVKATLRFLEDATGVDSTESSIRTLQQRLESTDRTADDLIAWARGVLPEDCPAFQPALPSAARSGGN